MVPLGVNATDWVLAREEGPHRIVAIHHALIHRRPGLWGDHPSRPNTLLLVREVDDRCDVFGAGRAEPAVAWLAAQHRPLNLLAPIEWEPAVRRRSGRVERGFVQTWLRPEDRPEPAAARSEAESESGDEFGEEPTDDGLEVVVSRPPVKVPIRRLTERDVDRFRDVAPDWALWSWGAFPHLIAHGAAFGVPTKEGDLASVAWILEEGRDRDKIGVATAPRFQRLGLGRAVSKMLVDHIVEERRRIPLWSAAAQNLGSQALARSLGFSVQVTETILRWVPR
ncbi:MAG: GNAT family N-acetyltransferase [Isosphaeraceae bacterium]|nr:GNAT family N-acetyltransferase [Isosphaeraceae bacterium]